MITCYARNAQAETSDNADITSSSFFFVLFNGGWQPALRCITATYYVGVLARAFLPLTEQNKRILIIIILIIKKKVFPAPKFYLSIWFPSDTPLCSQTPEGCLFIKCKVLLSLVCPNLSLVKMFSSFSFSSSYPSCTHILL